MESGHGNCDRRIYSTDGPMSGLAAEAVRLQHLSRLSLSLDGSRMLLMEVGCQLLASARFRRPDSGLEQITLN
jgi:hypothetical protein